jgi:hypothetical protein
MEDNIKMEFTEIGTNGLHGIPLSRVTFLWWDMNTAIKFWLHERREMPWLTALLLEEDNHAICGKISKAFSFRCSRGLQIKQWLLIWTQIRSVGNKWKHSVGSTTNRDRVLTLWKIDFYGIKSHAGSKIQMADCNSLPTKWKIRKTWKVYSNGIVWEGFRRTWTRKLPTFGTVVQEHAKKWLKLLGKDNLGHRVDD